MHTPRMQSAVRLIWHETEETGHSSSMKQFWPSHVRNQHRGNARVRTKHAANKSLLKKSAVMVCDLPQHKQKCPFAQDCTRFTPIYDVQCRFVDCKFAAVSSIDFVSQQDEI